MEAPSMGALGEVVNEESQCKVFPDGTKEWYNINRKFHRIEGPAVEWSNGTKEWWVNGKFLGNNDEGFWALWEKLTHEQRSNWKLLQWAPWVKS